MYAMLTFQMLHHEFGEACDVLAVFVDEEMVELPHCVVDQGSFPRRVTCLTVVEPVGLKQKQKTRQEG